MDTDEVAERIFQIVLLINLLCAIFLAIFGDWPAAFFCLGLFGILKIGASLSRL